MMFKVTLISPSLPYMNTNDRKENEKKNPTPTKYKTKGTFSEKLAFQIGHH